MDGLEKEMEMMKDRLDRFDGRLEEMNSNVVNSSARLEGVETGMETMKAYLREVRELLVAKEAGTSDKGKAPMEPPLSPTRSSPVRTTTPPPPNATEEPGNAERERTKRPSR